MGTTATKGTGSMQTGDVQRGIARIRTRLLDLTSRNRLINFRHPRTSSFRFVDTCLDVVFEHLVNGAELEIHSLPEEPAVDKEENLFEEEEGDTPQPPEDAGASARKCATRMGWNTELELPEAGEAPPRLRTAIFRGDFERIAKKITTTARTSLEESGANTLYLCFGFLRWKDVDGEQFLESPLVVLPVSIERQKSQRAGGWSYQLSYSGEDFATNLSLTEKMKELGIDLPSLDDEELPSRYLRRVREVIEEKLEWQVKTYLTLALLSFGKLLMYLDLNPQRWPPEAKITKHKIICSLFEGVSENSIPSAQEYDLDEVEGHILVPPLFYDADSSQHSVLIDALADRNLVVEGPPGTGKSQTITNLIASVIASGKSVLFVAEKSAALEVVKRRLEKIGLGEFCLELHSHRKQKRELLSGLENRIAQKGSHAKPANLEYKRKQLNEAKLRLNNYVRILNAPDLELEVTPFQAIWARHRAIESLPFNGDLIDEITISEREHLTKVAHEKASHNLSLFALLSKQLFSEFTNLRNHPWYGVNAYELGYGDQSQLVDLCRSALRASQAAAMVCESLRKQNLFLASTLQDLQYCLGLRDSLPRTAPDSVNELGSVVEKPECSDELRAFCKLIDQWRGTIAAINLLVTTAKRSDIREESVRDLRRATSDLQIRDYTAERLKNIFEEVESLILRIDNAAPLFLWARQKLAVSISDTREGAVRVAAALRAIEEAPASDLPVSNSELLRDDASAVLKKAQEDSQTLASMKGTLEKLYDLHSAPDQLTLRQYAAVLLDSNFVTRLFRADCRAAKRAYRRLLREPKTVPYTEMVNAFRLIAAYCDRREEYLRNTKYSVLAGNSYREEQTEWHRLIRVADWLSNARVRLGPGSEDLISWLASRSKTDIDGVRNELVPRKIQITAVEELCSDADDTLLKLPLGFRVSWEPSISVLRQNLQSCRDSLVRVLALLEQAKLKPVLLLNSVDGLSDSLTQEAELESSAEALAAKIGLGNCYRGAETDTEDILDALNFAIQLRKFQLPSVLLSWLLRDYKANCALLVKSLEDYISQLSILQSKLTSLIQLGSLSTSEFFGSNSDIYSLPLDDVTRKLTTALSVKDALAGYIDFIRAKNSCAETTHPVLANLVEERVLDPDHLRYAYDYVFSNSLAQHCAGNHLDLASFNGSAHERIRERFADLDREIMRLNAQYAAALIDDRFVHHGSRSGPVSQWTGLALLEHEIAKQKRHIPIRQLVNRAGSAVKALKPCFMMSPLSVAQYLEPGQVSFDLIVMDEASQLKPEDALGAIARGTQVVIVGDPKQLPPTSFFEALSADSDADPDILSAAEDAESILDVASSVFPMKRLRWHYRSRHQSLIHFSNAEFYKNLMIFPSPHYSHERLGVKYVPVPDGKFVNRRNTEEAQAVVEAVIAHIKQSPEESLGIVTLNYEQRELIDDLLDREFVSNPFADAFISNWQERSEPLFVKNLENVQGDERDVMFISVTYGPDEKGNQFQRFGPINGSEGHRRLNVLFTRAKNRVVVFSSLDSSKIVVEGNSSWGLKVLKKYLEFARTGEIPELATKGSDPDSDFEVSVADVIRAAGFDLEFQVGVAGFFIDIGVLDPCTQGKFLAGIECDGAAYHSAKSARDRDRLRQQILEDHHWKIFRVWSTDWFKNRQAEKARLISFLHALASSAQSAAGAF